MAVDIEYIINRESGGNPNARNPRSSAAGAGQFIKSTWLATVKRHRPDVAKGKTDDQILQLRYDPVLSREMTSAYASDNQDVLRDRGIEPNAGNTYLAHFAGPDGAVKLHQNPDAPVEQLLSPGAISANGFLRGMSGREVIDWAARKGSTGGSDASSAMARNIRKRFGAQTEGGATRAAGPGATGSGLPSEMEQVKASMAGKSYDPKAIEGADNLARVGQDIAGKAQNWQQALLGVGTVGVGTFLGGDEKKAKKEFDAALMGAVTGAQNPTEVAKLLIQSPDEKMKAAGLELLAKTVGQAPQSRTIDGPYGTKVQQDYVDGQWVTAGGGSAPSFSAAPSSQAAPPPQPALVEPVQPSQPIQQLQSVPAGAAPMLGAPELPTQNIGEVGPSSTLVQSNEVAKGDMLSIGGAQPNPAPAVSAPQAPAAPQFRVGAAVPKAPEGYVHKLAPNGAGYLYDQGGQPVFETKTEAEERSKAVVGNEADATARGKASQGFSAMLGELKMAPQQYGKQAFERALGPWSASTVQTEDEKGGFWGSGLSLNSVGQGIARANAELDAAFQGGAAPTEVRDSVETKLLNLATIAKPFVRKPGEGAWTDADQANLEKIVGKASRAKTVEEYNRRIDEAERVLGKAFTVKIPKVEAAPRTANAPKSAEDDVTGWEAYRKQYLGY